MTTAELELQNERLRVELEGIRLQNEKTRAEIDGRMTAEIAKLIAETSKLNSENRWYPAVVASGATLALVAVIGTVLRYLAGT